MVSVIRSSSIASLLVVILRDGDYDLLTTAEHLGRCFAPSDDGTRDVVDDHHD